MPPNRQRNVGDRHTRILRREVGDHDASCIGDLATDRSISAHRMTKVSPTAMMPVTEICVRMFCRLPCGEGFARHREECDEANSVTNGARLRS